MKPQVTRARKVPLLQVPTAPQPCAGRPGLAGWTPRATSVNSSPRVARRSPRSRPDRPPAAATGVCPGSAVGEVALLAGVSIDHYARLERGHLAGASDEVLGALGRPPARRSRTRPAARPGPRRRHPSRAAHRTNPRPHPCRRPSNYPRSPASPCPTTAPSLTPRPMMRSGCRPPGPRPRTLSRPPRRGPKSSSPDRTQPTVNGGRIPFGTAQRLPTRPSGGAEPARRRRPRKLRNGPDAAAAFMRRADRCGAW